MTSPAFNLPFKARVLHRREDEAVVLVFVGSTPVGTISVADAAKRQDRFVVEAALAEMLLGNLSLQPVEDEPEPEPEPEAPTDDSLPDPGPAETDADVAGTNEKTEAPAE